MHGRIKTSCHPERSCILRSVEDETKSRDLLSSAGWRVPHSIAFFAIEWGIPTGGVARLGGLRQMMGIAAKKFRIEAADFFMLKGICSEILSLGAVASVVIFIPPRVAAQTFSILHTFESSKDGGLSAAPLLADANGNLYGVTEEGSTPDCRDSFDDCGTVFELSGTSTGKWSHRVLYNFLGGTDGARPKSGLARDGTGDFYGATYNGGTGCGGFGCGTIFQLERSQTGVWQESVVYRFTGAADGSYPASALALDHAGDIYGTAPYGGDLNCPYLAGCGVVFKVHRTQGGTWKQTVLHTFEGGDGAYPYSGLVADSSGNLYGSTQSGGSGAGVIYQLKRSGNQWTETVLYQFEGGTDDGTPVGELLIDKQGNLYGATKYSGDYGTGAVFELSPGEGGWTLQLLHSFSGDDGWFPSAGVVADAKGNLYGTAGGGSFDNCRGGCGVVYKLDRSNGWAESPVYDLNGGANGFYPWATVFLREGKLYGTIAFGGDVACQSNEFSYAGCGVVFEIGP